MSSGRFRGIIRRWFGPVLINTGETGGARPSSSRRFSDGRIDYIANRIAGCGQRQQMIGIIEPLAYGAAQDPPLILGQALHDGVDRDGREIVPIDGI